MAFCTNCGARMADDAKFCANCGTGRAPSPPQAEAPPTSIEPVDSGTPTAYATDSTDPVSDQTSSPAGSTISASSTAADAATITPPVTSQSAPAPADDRRRPRADIRRRGRRCGAAYVPSGA